MVMLNRYWTAEDEEEFQRETNYKFSVYDNQYEPRREQDSWGRRLKNAAIGAAGGALVGGAVGALAGNVWM